MVNVQSFLVQTGLVAAPTYFDVAKDIGKAIAKPLIVFYSVIKIEVQGATRENVKNLGLAVLGGYEGIAMLAITSVNPWLDPNLLSRKITAATVGAGVAICSLKGFCTGLKLTKQHLGLKIAILACLAMCIIIVVKKVIRFLD
jgi:hypothetical protein